MQNLKYDTNELIYKTERDSHRKQTEGEVGIWGRDKAGVWDEQIHTTVYKTNNKGLLYSIGPPRGHLW